MVAEASGNWPGLAGEAAAELGASGRTLPPPPLPPTGTPVLALLLLELLEESCFFFDTLNFTLPESVSFSFSSSLLIGLSMIKPSCAPSHTHLPGQSQVLQQLPPPLFFFLNVTEYCTQIQCEWTYSRTKTEIYSYSLVTATIKSVTRN